MTQPNISAKIAHQVVHNKNKSTCSTICIQELICLSTITLAPIATIKPKYFIEYQKHPHLYASTVNERAYKNVFQPRALNCKALAGMKLTLNPKKTMMPHPTMTPRQLKQKQTPHNLKTHLKKTPYERSKVISLLQFMRYNMPIVKIKKVV